MLYQIYAWLFPTFAKYGEGPERRHWRAMGLEHHMIPYPDSHPPLPRWLWNWIMRKLGIT